MKSVRKVVVILIIISGALSLNAQVIMGTDRTAGAELLFIDAAEAEEAYGDFNKKAEKLEYINILLKNGGVYYNRRRLKNYSSLRVHFVSPINSSVNTKVRIGVEDKAPMKALYWLIKDLKEIDNIESPYGIYFFKKNHN